MAQIAFLAAASVAAITCSLFFAIIAVVLAIGSVLLMMSSVVLLGNEAGSDPLPQLPEPVQKVIDSIIKNTAFEWLQTPQQEAPTRVSEPHPSSSSSQSKEDNPGPPISDCGVPKEPTQKNTKSRAEKKKTVSKEPRHEVRTQDLLVSADGWVRKLRYDFHLYTPTTDTSFNTRALKQLIRQGTELALVPLHELSLTYKDDEGDVVSVSNDLELSEGLWLASKDPDVLFQLVH